MSTYGYFKHDEMSDYAIAHHGIKGQKWGIRRFQNEDGSLTPAGRRRYNINWAEKKPGWYYQTGQSIQDQHKMYRDIEKSFKKENKGISNDNLESKIKNEYKRIYKENPDIQYNLGKSSHDFLKTTQYYPLVGGAVGGGVAGAVTALAQMKDPNSPVSRHDRYREEILKKLAPEKSREFKSYSKQQKNTFLNKMSLDGAEDNPHVHKKGIGASYDTKVSWQKLPINLTFFDSNFNNKNNKKASNFYDKATDKKFLDKLILSSPDGKKDLSKLIDYYRVTYANDNGKDELIVEANIDSNGPAPAEYIFDGKTLKFKETNWV